MRKGLYAETPSMSHNDRDWLDVYRAAVMEFDRGKLPASIGVAEKAIHQRLRGLPIANSRSIANSEMHSTVLRFSRKCSSTFGRVEAFSVWPEIELLRDRSCISCQPHFAMRRP